MQPLNWKSELDIQARRKATLRFVWMVLAALVLAGNFIPVAAGSPLPLSFLGMLLVGTYLVIAFLLSRWPQTAKVTPHMLMLGMACLFTSLCMSDSGINSPVSHFLPLIPALASLLMRSNYCVIYGGIVALMIALLVVVDSSGSIRNASAYDIQNGATLIFTTAIVAAGSWFVAVHDERLIQAIKGKASYDELTNLPNRYSLRNHYEKLVAESSLEGAETHLTMINFGIDNFVQYNKTHGQEDGDRLLVRAAQTLVSLVRDNKNLVIGRNHGSAFTMVFSGHSNIEVERIISKVQSGFDALKIIDTPGHTLSISAAVLLFDLTDDNLLSGSDALIKANELLAWTQSMGHKRVETFSGDQLLNKSLGSSTNVSP